MYKIRPIGRDEEGHPQGARYLAYPVYMDDAVYYVDFDVEVTDEWESSRWMPGGWDYEMTNLRAWHKWPARQLNSWSRAFGALDEIERSVHQYIEDNPEEFLGQEVR